MEGKKALREIKASLRRLSCRIILYGCRIFPVNEKKYVFSSYFSTKYNDNPRAIFEAMQKMHPEMTYIWLLRDASVRIEGATVVNAGSLKALYHLATARCWIDNCRKRSWVVKRSKQKYVQTWHGGIAMKKVEADVAEKLPARYVKSAKRDSQMADIFLSGSAWQTNSIRRSYWYDGNILEYGLPRSDIFFRRQSTEEIDKLYNLSSETRILMYAPTFRADEELDCYDMDFKTVLKVLREKYGGEWAIFLRLHPNIADKSKFITFDNVIDVSKFQDINELIIRSDIVVTDYSSCMFDAMEAGKTVFLFATDIDGYAKDRGYEFSFAELPFVLAKTNDEFINNIINFDKRRYCLQVDAFMKKVQIYDDGIASYRVADYIFKHL